MVAASMKNPNICASCRSQKKKCDGKRPVCGRCGTASKETCVYPDPPAEGTLAAIVAERKKAEAVKAKETTHGAEEGVGMKMGAMKDTDYEVDISKNMDIKINYSFPHTDETYTSKNWPADRAVRSNLPTSDLLSESDASALLAKEAAFSTVEVHTPKCTFSSTPAKTPHKRKVSAGPEPPSSSTKAPKKPKAASKLDDSPFATANEITRKSAKEKHGRLQAEAMLSLRGNVIFPEPRAVIFADLRLSSLDPETTQVWNMMSRKVHTALLVTEESGIDWDVGGKKQRELRDLILELKAMQKKWRNAPELFRGLEKLALTVVSWHDFYELLGTCMSNLNDLSLVLGEVDLREEN